MAGKLSARSQSGTVTSASNVHTVNDPSGTPASSKETWASVALAGANNPQETGITAGTTQTQAGATALTKQTNDITTVTTALDGLKLLTAIAGLRQIVYNNGANVAKLYPNTSDNLGAGVDTAVLLEAGSVAICTAKDTTNWIVKIDLNVVDYTAFAGSRSITRAELYGGVIEPTTTGTLTLLAGDTGMNFAVDPTGVAVSINPDASEVIVLNGTALTGGNEIDIADGSMATFYWASTRWKCSGDSGVTDGGA